MGADDPTWRKPPIRLDVVRSPSRFSTLSTFAEAAAADAEAARNSREAGCVENLACGAELLLLLSCEHVGEADVFV